jgi:hypothetical protein
LQRELEKEEEEEEKEWKEEKYNHEEKFTLAVQKLHHYILIHTTKVMADSNPMQYLLSRQKINGKFS